VKAWGIMTALVAAASVLGPYSSATAVSLPLPPPQAGSPPAPAGSAPRAAAGHYHRIAVPRAAQTTPEEITDSGTIVGCFQSRTGQTRGFVDRRGSFTQITDPAARGRVRGCVLGANAHGVLVGYYATASGVRHGFRDDHGRFTTISMPGAGRKSGEGTVAVDINDAGSIVGYSISGGHVEQGFVFRHQAFTPVRAGGAGHAAGEGTWVSGISDNGTLAGGYVDASKVRHGFEYFAGRLTPIAVPGASATRGKGTAPGCISKHTGLVVGVYWRAAAAARPTGFSYRGRYRTLLAPGAARGTAPQCGNDSGRIVGVFYGRNGAQAGFEFIPSRG
jgi:hypothetical protein